MNNISGGSLNHAFIPSFPTAPSENKSDHFLASSWLDSQTLEICRRARRIVYFSEHAVFDRFVETGKLPDEKDMKQLAEALLGTSDDDDAGIKTLGLLVSEKSKEHAKQGAIYVLDLSGCQPKLGPKDANRIALFLEMLPCSISLNLAGNDLQAAGAKTIFQALKNSPLYGLDLSDNNIGDEGAFAIANLLPESKLIGLAMRANNIGSKGASSIAFRLHKSCLTALDLSENDMGSVGRMAIVAILEFANLQTLHLNNCNIGDDDARRIAETLCKKTQNKLTALSLNQNNIGINGITILAEKLPHTGLIALSLDANKIGNKGVAIIAEALPQSHLTALSLNANNIGNSGARKIAEVLPRSRINKLHLAYNKIGDQGVYHLVYAAMTSSLNIFNLSGNKIGDQGARALAHLLSDKKCTLTELYLTDNDIGEPGAHALADGLPHSQLISFDISENNMSDDNLYKLMARVPGKIIHLPEDSAIFQLPNRKIFPCSVKLPDDLADLYGKISADFQKTLWKYIKNKETIIQEKEDDLSNQMVLVGAFLHAVSTNGIGIDHPQLDQILTTFSEDILGSAIGFGESAYIISNKFRPNVQAALDKLEDLAELVKEKNIDIAPGNLWRLIIDPKTVDVFNRFCEKITPLFLFLFEVDDGANYALRLLKGWRFALNNLGNLDKPIDTDFIIQLHAKCTGEKIDDDDFDAALCLQAMEFGVYYTEKGLNECMRYMKKLQKDYSIEINLTAPNNPNDCWFHLRKTTRTEDLREAMDDWIAQYYKTVKKNPGDKKACLAAIAELYLKLIRLHPFDNANFRTVGLLLPNILLLQQKQDMSIICSPGLSAGSSVKKVARMMKEGQELVRGWKN